MTYVLKKAEEGVYGDRFAEYGHPAENHARTAELWSVFLGREVTATDVCMMNILQKVSRGVNKVTPDTVVDIAGYAENIGIIEGFDDGEPNEPGVATLGIDERNYIGISTITTGSV